MCVDNTVASIGLHIHTASSDLNVESHRMAWHGMNALVTSRERVAISHADAVGAFTHVITMFHTMHVRFNTGAAPPLERSTLQSTAPRSRDRPPSVAALRLHATGLAFIP